jgi:hypothetical protein
MFPYLQSAEVLKKFAQNVANPSTKDRLQILGDVAICVGKPGIFFLQVCKEILS